MPVILPYDLPAKDVLSKENIFFMNHSRAAHQDIRSLKVGILNLMPDKIKTETQLLRMLSNTSLQVEIDLIHTKSYASKHSSSAHLDRFYTTFDQIKHKKYDAMIITGAPVEQLLFEEVDYWRELQAIMDFARTQVYSTLFICWASQAALYHYYGIDKQPMSQKLFGVYKVDVVAPSALTRGFDNAFYVPQSRYTYCDEADIAKVEDLKIIARSDEVGVHIVASHDNRLVFVTGHAEYDEDTLKQEYLRDLARGLDTAAPKGYFVNDQPDAAIDVTWRAHGHLFYANWLNYCVYQETPYDINSIATKKVAKFGGSSLANGGQFKKVKDILVTDHNRQHIVVSAPGKDQLNDVKITDSLINCHALQAKKIAIQDRVLVHQIDENKLINQLEVQLAGIEARFMSICDALSLKASIRAHIKQTLDSIKQASERDYIISRGEYLSAKVLAEYLGCRFVDAKDIIFFDEAGKIDIDKTSHAIERWVPKHERVIIPGFYGTDANGRIKVFERGGSDITGSLIASGLNANLYENWTDVSGVMSKDPKRFKDAKPIPYMSYQELMHMAKSGAQVYHPAALEAVVDKRIPIHIKNTNAPEDRGTMVGAGVDAPQSK